MTRVRLLVVVGAFIASLFMCYYYIIVRTLRIQASFGNFDLDKPPTVVDITGNRVKNTIESNNTTNPANTPLSSSSSPNFLSIHKSTLPENVKPKATIAYLTSITACPAGNRQNFIDAAAVLKHSIHRVSIRNNHHHNNDDDAKQTTSAYDYAMYAIMHTEAADCAEAFRQIGYTVLLRDSPVSLSEIRNEKYVQRLVNPKAGCCQEKEFLKLYSYTMHEYPLVVHLDMDFIVLKPMDVLFDNFFLADDATKYIPHAMWPAERQWQGRIETMFTRDYPMGAHKRPSVRVGMQGGFWIVRPNQTAFDELLGIIRQGNFEGGWYDGNVHYPGFYGAAMIQGLIGFYYGHYHPGQAVELDRCIHNQMVDNPTDKQDRCFIQVDGHCRDCRVENVTDVYSAHFTFCFKPVSYGKKGLAPLQILPECTNE